MFPCPLRTTARDKARVSGSGLVAPAWVPTSLLPASPADGRLQSTPQSIYTSYEWQKSTEPVAAANLRHYVFKYTILDAEEHVGGPGDPNVGCTWRVVRDVEAKEGHVLYIVAFHWNSEFEKRENLRWEAVRDLV